LRIGGGISDGSPYLKSTTNIGCMRAIITGASAGIGQEMARQCHAKGLEVWLTGQNRDALTRLSKELSDAPWLSVDLSQKEGQIALLTWVADIEIDLWVNNAGYGAWTDVIDAKEDQLEKMIRLNVEALVHLSRVMAKKMVQRGQGRILNVASTAAFLPGPHMAAYYASKAFVLSFSESLHWELRGSGVTVTTLCPGPTRSQFFTRAGMGKMPLLDGPWMPIMSSGAVARAGIRATFSGKRRMVPGIFNYLSSLAPIFIPRFAQLGILNWLQGTKNQ
jgi:uncharacterized protein